MKMNLRNLGLLASVTICNLSYANPDQAKSNVFENTRRQLEAFEKKEIYHDEQGAADTLAQIDFKDFTKTIEYLKKESYLPVTDELLKEVLEKKFTPEEVKAYLSGSAQAYRKPLQALLDYLTTTVENQMQVKLEQGWKPFYELLSGREQQEYNENIGKKQRAGLGIKLDRIEGPEPVLVSEIMSLDTKLRGLKVGDKILAVDGESIESIRAKGGKYAVVDKIRGENYSYVKVKVQREKEEIELELYRKLLTFPAFDLISVRNGIVWIQVKKYIEFSSTEDFLQMMQAAEKFGAKGIVLDLRQSGGGSLQAATGIVRLFARQGDLLIRLKGPQDKKPEKAVVDGPYHKMPISVVVDSETSGAAEVIAQSLQKMGHKVIGDKTKGYGILKGSYKINDTNELMFISAILLLDENTPLQGNGINPDIYGIRGKDAVELAFSSME